jgi:hypothetical protein
MAAATWPHSRGEDGPQSRRGPDSGPGEKKGGQSRPVVHHPWRGPGTRSRPMHEGTIKTQNPKCCFYWCLIDFIRLEVQSVMLVFSTPLVYCCPSTFSLTSPTPCTLYTDSVWLWGDVELCSRPYPVGV